MVSNVLDLTEEELADELRRIAEKYADDPEWQKIRAELPDDWPF